MTIRDYLRIGILIFCFFIISLTGSTQEKILYQLTINVVGGGSVSPAPGTYYYSSGTTVFINAIPTADWAFDHWEGDISGTSIYTQVVMNGDKTITAVFVPAQWRLTLTHSGNATGTTFPNPGVYGFLDGQIVGISAGTSPGVYFGGWSGDAIGTDEFIQVYMNSDKNIDARFTNTGNTLNINIIGIGGTTPSPFGNPHRYSSDVYVNVTTYQTDPLWRFHHWEGDIGENEPTSYILFNLLMNQDREITAVFIEKPYYKLTIEIIGQGNVSLRKGFETPVTLVPGIHEYTYLEWTYIRCERIETTAGWKFLRWEGDFGDTSPTYPRCAFSMDKERYIRCIFTNQTHVPNVIGIPRTNANSTITNAWLTVGDVTEMCSDEYPSGYVVNQNPSAGTTVEIGTSVSLVLSTGPCPVTVPNVIGMTRTEAENAIVSAQLTLGNVTEQCNSEVPVGEVIGQDPVGGASLPPGGKVNIIVSAGPCPVAVPNIIWQLRSTAESMIINAGLVIGIVTEQCDDNIPANRVINQYPPVGQMVLPGSSVNFAVSSGPCLATVPNVISYVQSIAENIITTAGLVVGEVTRQCHPTVRAGIVISQSPSAGTRVTYGTAVDFVLSTGPCPIEVPNVVNMSQNLAETTITGAGLSMGAITQQCSNSVPIGLVISQNPSAGEQVNPGTKINLVVSTGSCNEGTIEGIYEGEGFAEGTLEGGYEGIEEGEGTGEGVVEGFMEGEFYVHSADQNGDWKIDLRELLRVIQFFNSGGYHCEEGTEDGYAPGIEGDKTCLPHSSDYNEQDWIINLPEILRIIQFFNIGSFYPCLNGEDGYCPG